MPSPTASPLLDRLAGRGRRIKLMARGGTLLAQQFEAFGLPCAADGDCPAAALGAWSEGVPGAAEAFWLRFDPVHLLAHKSQLLLMDPQVLSLRPGEAAAFAEALNAHFGSLGWQLTVLQPDCWYLCLAEQPHLRTTPLAAAIGRDIDSLLPQGQDARRWHTYLNEVQMLLHDHPCNQVREDAGLPTVNSVWPWGGGQLPPSRQGPWRSVVAEDNVLQALGRFTGATVLSWPADLRPWVGQLEPGAHLLFYGEAFDTAEMLSRFEQDLLRPLVESLKLDEISALLLIGGMDENQSGMPAFELNRGQLGRWWRRARPFLAGQAIGEPTDWASITS